MIKFTIKNQGNDYLGVLFIIELILKSTWFRISLVIILIFVTQTTLS